MRVNRTSRVINIRKVVPILRARHKNTPECAPDKALLQMEQVCVTLHGAISKRQGKIRSINVILVVFSDIYRQVIVTICQVRQQLWFKSPC